MASHSGTCPHPTERAGVGMLPPLAHLRLSSGATTAGPPSAVAKREHDGDESKPVEAREELARAAEARKEVVQNPDLLRLVLAEALDAPDYASAFEVAKSVCAADTTLVGACEPLWSELNERFFANSPIKGETLRGTFLRNCARAQTYRNGSARLRAATEAWDRNCTTFVLEAMRHEPLQMRHASEDLLRDGAFLREAASIVPDYQSADELATDVIGWHPDVVVDQAFWKALNKRFFGDSSVTGKSTELDTLRKNCERAEEYRHGILWLQYDEHGENDHDCATFVLEAVRLAYTQIRDASDRLKNDVAFMVRAMRVSAWCLPIVSEAMQNNRDVVLAAVETRGTMLASASPELKADREIVTAAITNDGEALLVADEAYLNDAEIVKLAASKDPRTLQYATQEVRNDRDVVLEVVRLKPKALRFAGPVPRDDKDVVMAAVQASGTVLRAASERLRGDVDVVVAAMRVDARAYVHALPPARDDPEVQALRRPEATDAARAQGRD